MQAKSVVCGMAIGILSAAALAQPPSAPKDGPASPPMKGEDGARRIRPEGTGLPAPLSPEAQSAAWNLQALGVAHHLGLKDEQGKALAKAYADARVSYGTAMKKVEQDIVSKLSGAGEKGQIGAEVRKAMADAESGERAKFEKSLTGIVSGDQLAKVMGSLGTFNRQWDAIAHAIADLKLDAAKQQSALDIVEEYVSAAGKVNAGEGDPQANREVKEKARQTAMDALRKVLNDEEYKKVEASMRAGGRMMRGGGPGVVAPMPGKLEGGKPDGGKK